MVLHFINPKFALTSLVIIIMFFILRRTNCFRTKRTLAFTRGNSFGYLAAVAIPLDLPNRNIYVAFNLETNYGLPPNDTHYDLIQKWNLTGMFSEIGNGITRIESARSERSLYTRNNFYRSVTGYLELFGFNGTGCLLRTICEVAESRLSVSNGLFGSIFHVLFMPTSSKEELIPQPMYEAENNGYNNQCQIYEESCPEGILNIISVEL